MQNTVSFDDEPPPRAWGGSAPDRGLESAEKNLGLFVEIKVW